MSRSSDAHRTAPPLPQAVAGLALVHEVPLAGPGGFGTAQRSLIGREAISVEVDSIRRSIIGLGRPGFVRVTFRLRVVNRMERVRLLTPTFPAAPDAEAAVYLFVANAAAVDLPGGVTQMAPNELGVRVPGAGRVEPTVDWDGGPWDYLRSTPCRVPGSTCARYERFRAPMAAGSVSEARWVGFDVEPQVRHLRLHLVLAADLANTP